MNCTDCQDRLHDYVAGDLPALESRAFDAHVAGCAACRTRLDALRALLASAAALPRALAPARDLWPALRQEIEALTSSPLGTLDRQTAGTPPRTGASFLSWFAPLAVAASVAVVLTLHERSTPPRPAAPGWSVAALAGAPRVDRRAIRHEGTFSVGQWLETDATSRAKVAVGTIGEVTLDPNSRLRLAGISDTNHRLELQRGSLRAFIVAPPRLFFVDTPSATAVDLGCAYTLTVADNGDGELHVTSGYVALEHGDRESIIPRDMRCLTRRGAGPGTPFASDAPEPLRRALTRFDFEPGAATRALPEILAHARDADTVTLWHLLARTEGLQRAAVFDALRTFSAPPTGVTREGILAGDAAMRRAWASEIGIGPW